MGACDQFGTLQLGRGVVPVKHDDRDAVRTAGTTAISDACYQHGHGGYTGTIAECVGVDYHASTAPMDEEEAQVYLLGEWVDGRYVDGVAEKWGPLVIVRSKTPGLYYYGAVCSS